jgi:hypothetical protein
MELDEQINLIEYCVKNSLVREKAAATRRISRNYKRWKLSRIIRHISRKNRLNRELLEFSQVPPMILSEEGWQNIVPFKLVSKNKTILNWAGMLVREYERSFISAK